MFVYKLISNQLAARVMTLSEMQTASRPLFVVFATQEQTRKIVIWCEATQQKPSSWLAHLHQPKLSQHH